MQYLKGNLVGKQINSIIFSDKESSQNSFMVGEEGNCHLLILKSSRIIPPFQHKIKASKKEFFFFLILSLEKESLSSVKRCASLFMFLPSRKQLNRGKTEFTNIPVCSCQGTSEKPKLGLPGFGVGSPVCLELKPRRVALRSREPLFPSGPDPWSLCPKEASLR